MFSAMTFFFFFNDTATTEIYTLSLHDALPISRQPRHGLREVGILVRGSILLTRQEGIWILGLLSCKLRSGKHEAPDRKSTRLNSSHANISYAVFCLKKKHRTHA